MVEYCVIYNLSKGLSVCKIELVARRSIQPGGKNWNHIWCLPTDSNLNPNSMAELTASKTLKHPNLIHFILTLCILFGYEMVQMAVGLIYIISIILQKIETKIYSWDRC